MPNQRPLVGMGVLVVRGDTILLGRRIGSHMSGYYAAPGGHLEYGESFVDCAYREVKEETGLHITNIRFLTVGNYKFGARHYVDIDMMGESVKDTPQCLEPKKCEGWGWYHFSNLPHPLFPVTKAMLEVYKSGFVMNQEVFKSLVVTDDNDPCSVELLRDI